MNSLIKNRIFISLLAFFVFVLVGCGKSTDSDFIKVENGQFVRNGEPYYYVGTNFWYGAILASKGEGGNRERLKKELDFLKKQGIDNLRILVGADGERGVKTRVEPTLQVSPGIYNDTILDGLDYLMKELAARKMYAVLYLNNSWEWSGGYSMYLQWSGAGKAVIPAIDGWGKYMTFVSQFVNSDSSKALFANHVRNIITRKNRYTHKKYIDDPAIMSWQIGNEPRAFSDENKVPFALWMSQVSALIKSLDPNHLVSSGSEGKWGCEGDITLFEKIHADKNIDYLNMHIWPYNWKWVKSDSLSEKLPAAKENTEKYIQEHLNIAKKLNKPLVLEEFGFPRDDFRFSKDASTNSRDSYYQFVFNFIKKDAAEGGYFAGVNFWGWGGFANPSKVHIYWQKGDDYTGDPAQEEQGLNSVFSSDKSTLNIIRETNEVLKKISNTK
ncbi:conserved hypothetical protein [uncultured Paludibacter sp.]|uniref:mannan endo-1,4-beta-mannosidase n=1 Tax=uncultured Paludibacter sp. TaxID=497635 RepID=A0A653A9I0_9BACT|nr:conserved hypothetical protein [uncultured Paludibacter sp.]